MHYPKNPLRLNAGFLINQPVGTSRDFDVEIQRIFLPPDLELSDLIGTAHVTRTAQGLLVQVRLHATLVGECGRCLTDFQLSLDTDFTELYAFSHNSVTESNLRLPENGQINLAPLVREYMILEIPITSLCQPDCKGLCPLCGENLNENTCNHNNEAIDPRLSILKSLLDGE
ncbi:MAG: DUF177 domain-containing protein [Anaerolineales bacterium]|nr:MAG: DUF177 domain-containing protein [Anaerolineales bacterium]